MARFGRGGGYDRSKLMRRAAAARARGRYKKSIALYRRALEGEPDSTEIHKKLAPLLVKTKQAPEALTSYQVAAGKLVRQGFSDQALGLMRAAAAQLPSEASLWQNVADLELKRGRPADAVQALVDGRRHMRSRKLRPEAIRLLAKARKIDPSDFRVTYDLGCLLGKTGRRATALRLFDELAGRPDRRHLARVRARQLWLSPGVGAVGRYLRALLLRR